MPPTSVMKSRRLISPEPQEQGIVASQISTPEGGARVPDNVRFGLDADIEAPRLNVRYGSGAITRGEEHEFD